MSKRDYQRPLMEKSIYRKKRCPSCMENIHPNAKKCHFCGEVVTVSRFSIAEYFLKKTVAYAGLFTAILSLFFGLREGYYFIKERQEKRDVIESHTSASHKFEKIGNLEYAVKALETALSVKPNDIQLQIKLFCLRSDHFLKIKELDNPLGKLGGFNKTDQDTTGNLTLDGFRLLNFKVSKITRSEILRKLGRLLSNHFNIGDDEETLKMFSEAYMLTPKNSDAAFRYGLFLLKIDKTPDKGVELITKAIALNPQNSLYHYILGEYQRKRIKDYKASITSYEKAIDHYEKQTDSVGKITNKYAKTSLLNLITKLDKESDITSEIFFDMTKTERKHLLKKILSFSKNNKSFNFLSARFFHANGEDELSLDSIEKALQNKKFDRIPYGSEILKLKLYVRILEKTKKDPVTLHTIKTKLEAYEKIQSFEEVMVIGQKGKHNYRIGLRVKKNPRNSKEKMAPAGVTVLHVYKGYPFAKAGLQKGDRIFKLDHRSTRQLSDIWTPIIQFDPGTKLPIRIERGKTPLNLTLTVE